MKKMISVPVGCEPKIARYRYGGSEYIDYGYAAERLYPESSLKSLLNEFVQLQKKYCDSYQDMTFVERRDCYCPYECSCSSSYILYGKRYETDLEYNFRLAKEAEVKAACEARDRAEYEKLRARFEKSEERG